MILGQSVLEITYRHTDKPLSNSTSTNCDDGCTMTFDL